MYKHDQLHSYVHTPLQFLTFDTYTVTQASVYQHIKSIAVYTPYHIPLECLAGSDIWQQFTFYIASAYMSVKYLPWRWTLQPFLYFQLALHPLVHGISTIYTLHIQYIIMHGLWHVCTVHAGIYVYMTVGCPACV